MIIICPHLKAKGKPEETPLFTHLDDVATVIEKVADYLNMDPQVARYGAILHDIGKASTIFQKRLTQTYKRRDSDKPFRHEIASCFFLSLFEEQIQPQLMDMVIAHHKSMFKDAREKGIVDLFQNWEDEIIEFHLQDWEAWMPEALKILKAFGIPTREISKKEAEQNFFKVYEYCESKIKERGYSAWRGLLMAADHFASALPENYKPYLDKLFRKSNLNFFNRKHELYPLSSKSAYSDKKHTMLVACTGAGKTDFLFRRCKGRVFYTLPFQASINAMYNRVKHDLEKDNPNLDIRLLHASSSISAKGTTKEEKIIQGHVGSSIKVLTPHQIAAIAFGTNGYEAMIADIKGCDVILDEIHTYTDITRAIVLKIIQVLDYLNCRVHVGTATMPSILYNKIIDILGKENVLEVKLEDGELEKFNRHEIHKVDSWDKSSLIVDNAIGEDKKILLVCNRVQNAQKQYEICQSKYPDVPILLLHSRFTKSDRDKKEQLLMGLDEDGKSNGNFSTSNKACIVVSTQVVEVSLDISFDIMITEAAPLDALIQRFGRVNRKRTPETIGHYKPIYVIAPPENEKEALPYNLEIIKRSYKELPDGELLKETELQLKIDNVFTEIDFLKIENHSVFKESGKWSIAPLTHNSKALLLDLLEIDSVNCICEADEEKYQEANYEERAKMTLSTRYWVVKDLRQLNYGSRPFTIPDKSYNTETGFQQDLAKPEYYDTSYSFL
ncbi:CRISPR-associated helicase Cas3' [Sunxiuqinia sp. sy24]|uniref:CRISPR-associated helicase Cas3' n=1 Tax=Sunxiuqinia sp. sy24 TaxID=3461495 RepID=UPI0040452CB5